ncbi:MAG: prepilin peptidase [Bauldia sp.]
MAADSTQYAFFVIFAAMMAYAAVNDILTMTISNRLTAGLVVGFVAFAPLIGMDWQTFALHGLAGALVLAVAFFCFAMGWIGGGDAKLAAVIALWVGIGNTLSFIVLASLLGGALTMLLLAFRRSVVPIFLIRQAWVQRLHDEKGGVPYGVALAAAGLATFPDTVWMRVATG